MTDFDLYGPPTDDVIAQNLAAQLAHTGRRKADPPKRSGKTPEAKVANKIDDYLALLGMINIRTNAGSWQDDNGNWIMGAKAGTSDKTCCTPHGCFLAIETKAPRGRLSAAQKAYRSRVEALGGTYVVAKSVKELKTALSASYGPQRVAQWEAEGRARQAAKKARIDDLKRKNGQL